MSPGTLKVVRRMGFAAAALGAEAVLLWPGEDWKLKPEALVAILVAVAGWVYLELKEQTDDTLQKA